MPSLPIRIDANEAWTAATAADRIRELEPFGISLVEQPVKHEEVASLSEVRKAVKTPIMLDESLCSMIDAVRAKESAGATCSTSALAVRRVSAELRLAAYAKANGLQCQLGSHPGESSLLTRPAAT